MSLIYLWLKMIKKDKKRTLSSIIYLKKKDKI